MTTTIIIISIGIMVIVGSWVCSLCHVGRHQLMSSAMFNTSNGGAASITARNYPLPYTTRQNIVLSGINSVFVALGVVIGFSFIAAFYAAFLVTERENSAKHQQVKY